MLKCEIKFAYFCFTGAQQLPEIEHKIRGQDKLFL